MIKFFLVFIVLLLAPGEGSADSQWLKKFGDVTSKKVSEVSLYDTKIGQGLKEALKVGIENAVKTTGKVDGFLANDQIKIGLPQKLQIIDKPLRIIGFGRQIDAFVLSMNRAAEKAAPLALDIFLDAILQLNMGDVQALYKGKEDSATQFLKNKTYNKLKQKFTPMVTTVLNEYQVTKKYRDIMGRYEQIAFSQKFQPPSIEDYVVGKTLEGLFVVLAQEEANIRKNPAARTTSLLKEIFK